MSSSLDPTKAIEESEATGEVADLFAEIREVMGIPLVTSIWRCLAGVPDALPTTWAAVRSLMASGELAALECELRSTVALPIPDPLTANDLISAGATAADRKTVLKVVDAYNRSNCRNLIAITALLRNPISDRPVIPVSAEPPNWSPFPRLTPPADISPDQWTLLRATTTIGAAKTNSHIPTLWRHLLDWPGILTTAVARYDTPTMHQSLVSAVEDLTQWVESNAPRLSHLIDQSPQIPAPAREMLTNYIGPQPSVARMCTVGCSAAQWLRASA